MYVFTPHGSGYWPLEQNRSLCPLEYLSLLEFLRCNLSLGQSKGIDDRLLFGRRFGCNFVGYFHYSIKLLNRGRGLSLREVIEQSFDHSGPSQREDQGKQHFTNSIHHLAH